MLCVEQGPVIQSYFPWLVNLENTEYFARLFELCTMLALFSLFCSLIMFGSSNLEKPSTAKYYSPGRLWSVEVEVLWKDLNS